jgi:hypothetical protein
MMSPQPSRTTSPRRCRKLLLSEAPTQYRDLFTIPALCLQVSRKLEWRDPDSNRGHHDFQAFPRAFRYAADPHR